MEKPEILLIYPYAPPIMEVLEARHTVHRYYEAGNRDALVADVGERIRAIATNGHHGASASLIDALPNLEIIASYGVGYDAVDVGHAATRNVVVTNTPNVLNDDVANFAIVLLLAASRNVVAADRYVRDGKWLKGEMALARAIRDKPVGILGLGRIGKNIAEKLQVFGCDVRYHGRHRQTDQPYRYYDNLVQLAKESDYLIVICPASEATHGIVNREVMDALGPSGTLINVARGSVVDESALVNALSDGSLGGAALDVFADEPRVPRALMEMDNVILQPHLGSATVETRRAMGELVLENLRLHFAGEPVATPVHR